MDQNLWYVLVFYSIDAIKYYIILFAPPFFPPHPFSSSFNIGVRPPLLNGEDHKWWLPAYCSSFLVSCSLFFFFSPLIRKIKLSSQKKMIRLLRRRELAADNPQVIGALHLEYNNKMKWATGERATYIVPFIEHAWKKYFVLTSMGLSWETPCIYFK